MMIRVSRGVAITSLLVTIGLGCSSASSDAGDAGTSAAGTDGNDGGASGSQQVGGSGGSDSEDAGSHTGGTGEVGGGGNSSGGVGGDETGGFGGANSEGGVGGSGGEDGTGGAGGSGGASLEDLDPFSFFVTSQAALVALAPDENGFGGDLRFGEETGLAGADKICATLAEQSMPGSSAKQWRAFLSVTTGGVNDGPIDAIDRIGAGPWYDRNGRLIANDVAGLLGVRPDGDAQAVLDLPNETGEPNHAPGGMEVDNHDTLTGSDKQGRLASTSSNDTCGDWTRNDQQLGRPMLGHSWPRNANNPTNGGNWMSDHNAQGCLPKVNTEDGGGGPMGCNGVGCGGGYGGFYCFALNP